MPEFYYGGTITFDTNFNIGKKEKLISEFHKQLSRHLDFRKDTNEYQLIVTREYHKVDNQDDYEAPHLHFILISTRQLPKYRVTAVNEFFRHFYGRSQFYRMTTMKYHSYRKYIQKDCERLQKELSKPHYFETMLYHEEYQEDPEDFYGLDNPDDL